LFWSAKVAPRGRRNVRIDWRITRAAEKLGIQQPPLTVRETDRAALPLVFVSHALDALYSGATYLWRWEGSMSVLICGEARRLRISYEAGDKSFHGYASSLDGPDIGDLLQGSSANPACYVGIYAEKSEQLRKHLIVTGRVDEGVVARYSELTTLTKIGQDRSGLFVSAMLKAADFSYFAGLTERYLLTNLIYVLDLPFYGFPVSALAQANVAASEGYILPTREEFRSGKPALIPNTEISFSFSVPTD
jgi:hypothetical protein